MAVYSATQFHDELDLLEIRLNVLNPVVDYFIISESTRTFSGNLKPLYYLENKERYKKFHKKIIHQVVEYTPSNAQELFKMKPKNKLHTKVIGSVFSSRRLEGIPDPFYRDNYEKEILLTAMETCKPEDVILLGDLDEIPRPEAVEYVLNNFDSKQIYQFTHDNFYVFFNLQKTSEPWIGTFATSFENLMTSSFAEIRAYKPGIGVTQGGWHFTYIGDAKTIEKKIVSNGHQEFNNYEVKSRIQERIDRCIELQQDILGRPSTLVLRDINDGSFPKYIVENQERYKDNIKWS